MEMNGTAPVFNEDHYINIRKGRHPLLHKKKVVPIDIHLGKDFDLLIRILKVGAVRAGEHGIQLGADFFVGLYHGAANALQPRAGIVGNLLLGENTAAYLVGHMGQGATATWDSPSSPWKSAARSPFWS